MTTARKTLYIGLMSGTSVDGIDAALCCFDDGVRTLDAISHPWPEPLREALLGVAQGEQPLDLDRYGQLDVAVGRHFAAAVHALLAHAGIAAGAVRAIGSHGQTIRHRPQGDAPFTLQIGDASVIAENTGIDTVADFRRADVAAGGQGAPLMPAFHAAALAGAATCQVVLNLGGIANITVLDGEQVTGLDTGPANALMDAWCQRHTGRRFDAGGTFAASGHANEGLLTRMLADPYFSQPAPKSTGREYFHLAWLQRFGVEALAPADVQATLLALTARSVADAIRAYAPGCTRVQVCGGGVHNALLMQTLQRAMGDVPVTSTADIGLDPDHVEAAGFAWLAMRRLHTLPGNRPAVTGARGERLLGVCYAAPRQTSATH